MGKKIWGENNPSSSRSTDIRLRYLLLPPQKKWKKPKPPKPRIQTQKITNKQTNPFISITSYLSCQRIKNGSPAQKQEDISPLNTPLLLTPGWELFPPQRITYHWARARICNVCTETRNWRESEKFWKVKTTGCGT